MPIFTLKMILEEEGVLKKANFPYLLSNVYSRPLMVEGTQQMFGTYSQSLKLVPGQQKLSERFKRHCATKEGAKLT